MSAPSRLRVTVASAAALLMVAGLGAVSTGAASAAPAAPAAAPVPARAAAPADGLIGEYLFSQTSGSTVANTATGDGAVGDATVVNGSDGLWTGDSLTFTGGAASSSTANWVELPDDVLAGATSATITTETKLDASMKSQFNFLWNIGNASTQQYYFASVRDTPRTAITTNGGGGEVNARSGSALDADRWYSLTSVIDGEADTITFYVDGVRVSQTATTLTPGSITDQSLNTIGRSPWPDPVFKGEVSAFRVYDRALSAEEVGAVSDTDATAHAESFAAAAQGIVDGLSPVVIDDSSLILPDAGGAVRWASSLPGVTVGDDGKSVTAELPAAGEPALTGTLTATATVRGVTASREVDVTVEPEAAATDDYGYLMVHFIEDSEGYAEKIYLDVSRGDNPEQWDPLNGGEPILASDLGTTGVRDPYLTYNPETETYYIIATDLRVFGGDQGSGTCTTWCHWTRNASTMLNIWESKDLVTWGDLRQIDVGAGAAGALGAELGMAWAPEATWVDDYNADGSGAFVVYWSSTEFPASDPEQQGASYSRVLYGATPDFTQETYEFGGEFVDLGGDAIDTTMIQDDGTTYRITKDNAFGDGIYMEATEAERWWESGTTWRTLQTEIGAVWSGGNPGGVEGPAVFKSHSEDRWYLYVDVIPSTGYRPMETTDLEAGWTQLTGGDFYMAPSTKHGGIVSLTKAQYDTVRAADAVSVVESDLGSVTLSESAEPADVAAALPATAAVNLAYERGTAELPVTWNTSAVDLSTPGTYGVTGTVQSIGANLNQWVGAGGSTAYDVADRELFSSTRLEVTASVVVPERVDPEPSLTVDRIAGADRYEVAVNTSKAGFPEGSDTVYVASGEVFPDALSAAPAATVAGAPILLTTAANLPTSVSAEIERLGATDIVIVGGTSTVSTMVEASLATLGTVSRIGGADRFEASRNIAAAAFPRGTETAVLATGTTFSDALAAGAAIDGDGPVILINGSASRLDAATRTLLEDLGVSDVVIAGGEASVSAGIQADAARFTSVVRLGGADRFAAARSINDHFFTEADHVLLATGLTFPDALSGSAYAPRIDAPLFTVLSDCIPAETLAQIEELGATKVTLLGGTATLTEAVENLVACP
ncbi:cell wall-binding repeat-containing protein [Herbiconiux sp. P15]|uniref:cell wall-binding repeat-containing protein n=1 Tax=Herbiconiux liukaitaii TaxID=3342799 RepID=UPI0035B80498